MRTMLLNMAAVGLLALGSFGATTAPKASSCCGDKCCTKCPTCCTSCCDKACCGQNCCGSCPTCCK